MITRIWARWRRKEIKKRDKKRNTDKIDEGVNILSTVMLADIISAQSKCIPSTTLFLVISLPRVSAKNTASWTAYCFRYSLYLEFIEHVKTKRIKLRRANAFGSCSWQPSKLCKQEVEVAC